MIAVICGLCESDADVDLQLLRSLEDRSRVFCCSHSAMFEERLEFHFIGDEVTREEGRKSTFWEEHSLCALSSGLIEKMNESIYCVLTDVSAMDCANLCRGYTDRARHAVSTGLEGVWKRSESALATQKDSQSRI